MYIIIIKTHTFFQIFREYKNFIQSKSVLWVFLKREGLLKYF